MRVIVITRECPRDPMDAMRAEIDRLREELAEERYRHDRLQDFEVAEAQELASLKIKYEVAMNTLKALAVGRGFVKKDDLEKFAAMLKRTHWESMADDILQLNKELNIKKKEVAELEEQLKRSHIFPIEPDTDVFFILKDPMAPNGRYVSDAHRVTEVGTRGFWTSSHPADGRWPLDDMGDFTPWHELGNRVYRSKAAAENALMGRCYAVHLDCDNGRTVYLTQSEYDDLKARAEKPCDE